LLENALDSFQKPLVDKCPCQPNPETHEKYDRKRKLFLKTEECSNKEKNTGQDAPKGSFGKGYHDIGIPTVLQVHPDQHESTGQRHNPDKTGERRVLFPDPCGDENNEQTKYRFDKDLHVIFSLN